MNLTVLLTFIGENFDSIGNYAYKSNIFIPNTSAKLNYEQICKQIDVLTNKKTVQQLQSVQIRKQNGGCWKSFINIFLSQDKKIDHIKIEDESSEDENINLTHESCD